MRLASVCHHRVCVLLSGDVDDWLGAGYGTSTEMAGIAQKPSQFQSQGESAGIASVHNNVTDIYNSVSQHNCTVTASHNSVGHASL